MGLANAPIDVPMSDWEKLAFGKFSISTGSTERFLSSRNDRERQLNHEPRT